MKRIKISIYRTCGIGGYWNLAVSDEHCNMTAILLQAPKAEAKDFAQRLFRRKLDWQADADDIGYESAIIEIRRRRLRAE